ncbi:MAG: hypothetical protein KME11_05035 [Timaviella obliquedivisa GSE-PSE-MK23-08B]|jgi:hypothetical protein|nr:hypothetical protein [Timaviella obliquedivisa GSE-PSE-MK23-08B]
MPTYDRYYELEQSLQIDPSLIPSPELYGFSDDQIYAAIMDRLAQPLPTGEPSPFSAKTPGSAHAILTSVLVYLQSLIAHEFNLVPDAALLEWLRMMGTQLRAAEYSVLNVRFTRSQDAIARNIAVDIPINIEIRSLYQPNLSVYTISSARMELDQNTVLIPCRLNQIGKLPNIRQGEFSQIPRSLAFVDTAANEGVITEGRSSERLIDAVYRTRDWLRTGDRCVTDRDFQFYALRVGAQKVNVIRGRMPGVDGFFRDLRAIAVYPSTYVSLVEAEINPRRMKDERLAVFPAEIIPIDGLVQIKVLSDISQVEAFNLAATAITDSLNPPHGVWGDREYNKSLAEALERVRGIYAVPLVQLKHAQTNVPLKDLDIKPWHLLEIQQSIKIEVMP